MKANLLKELSLLRQNALFVRLFYASIVSGFGDWLNSIAVLVIVLQLTGSATAVGVTLALRTLPYLVMGPIGGVWSDRLRRTRIMIACDLARAAIALGFLFVSNASDMWLVYVLTALLVVFSAWFVPARSAYLGTIVEKDGLGKANAWMGGGSGLVMILGMSVGGLLTAYIGVAAAFIINSATFIVSALLLLRAARVEVKRPIASAIPPFRTQLDQGLQAVMHNGPVRLLLLLEVGWAIGGGALNVLLSFMAHEVFQLGGIGVGIAYASLGAGTLVGSMVAAKFSGVLMSNARIAAGAFIVFDALLDILFANSSSAIMGNIVLTVTGCANAIANSAILTLIGTCTDNALQGRVFSMFNTIGSSLLALSMALVGMLIPVFGTRLVGTTGGLVILCFGAAYLVLLSRERRYQTIGE